MLRIVVRSPEARSTVDERPRQRGGVRGDGARPLGVVVAGDLARRADHRVDRRREPAAGGVADDLAADQQHQHRRDQRQAEQRRHQLGAEARERQRPPALDHQLEDVAGQHEDQRQHQRQVGDRHRVEDDRAEEVERQLRRARRQRQHRGQGRDEQPDPQQDQDGVVPQRPARGEPPQASRGHGTKVKPALPCADGRAHGQNDQVWRGEVRPRTRTS